MFLFGFVYLLRFHGEDPAVQLALKAKRVELVERMETNLAAASEAEKSAVLAVTDHESRAFADEARAYSANVEQERGDLGPLLEAGAESELFARFSSALTDFRALDDKLLALAVENSNVKAYSIAYGPAADAVQALNTALSHLVSENENAVDAKAILLFSFGAETSALRMQTLFPPHIAEESDAKMDELERSMAVEDEEIRRSLDGLEAIPRLRKDPDLATATAKHVELGKLKAQILALSRENTNVRSLSISVNQKRKVMQACESTLSALRQAIQAEPDPSFRARR